MKQILFYIADNGKSPVKEWLKSLDKPIMHRVADRLTRLSEGNFGDCRNLKDGVSELRMFFSKGYRIYYSEIDDVIILLLNAGDKQTQSKDIERAKKYLKQWSDNNEI